jgi:murein DD-endopeptidase MepM/ murein hydrolase activator NlpD
MRRLPLCACVLTLLAAPASAPAAGPHTGGTAAPSFVGGTTHGQPVQEIRRRSRLSSRPVATEFSVAPATLDAGQAATFTFRVDGRMRTVRVRIELTRAGAAAPAKRLRLGYRRTGLRQEYIWTPRAGELPGGEYRVELKAFDDAGHRLLRTARAPGRQRVFVSVSAPAPSASSTVFPVQGDFDFGGEESRFGAARDGHTHQGQDIAAAEGTPLVAPMAATVTWIAYQAGGAGHYVVLRAEGENRSYVFMHLLEGSVRVREGDRVGTGERLADVGSTGSSTGPHLHFEVWVGEWFGGGHAIDPLPDLRRWDAWS